MMCTTTHAPFPSRTTAPARMARTPTSAKPPILVDLGLGKRALVIAQKSGMVDAIDPDARGKLLWQTRVGQGGPLGGSQWGSASDGEKIYVAISDAGLGARPDPQSPAGYRLVLDPKKGGGLYALEIKTGKV